MIYTHTHGSSEFRSADSPFVYSKMDQTFRYYFPDAPIFSHDSSTVTRLDALADAMVNNPEFVEQNSLLPPFMTYFGQFIDHDITAGTDSGAGNFNTVDPLFSPVNRKKVVSTWRNLRTGLLDLDSVYGGEVTPGSFDEKLVGLMRISKFPGKMRIARPQEIAGQIVPLPIDGASDNLRLGRFLEESLTVDELRSIPQENLRNLFFFVERDDDGNAVLGDVNPFRAIIGDARNDENLFVSQFHLAILRFHNRLVDSCDDNQVIDAGDDALFNWARDRVRWTYQWLVVNEYLGRICDAEQLSDVIANDAPLYRKFRQTGPDLGSGRLPMPIEFSAAAFRFGHSMVRAAYDWNEFFPFPSASIQLLFQFTGSVRHPMSGVTDDRLPSNWVADWDKLARVAKDRPERSSHKVDTNLSFGLGQLPAQADAGSVRPIPNLAIANLRKGHLLNLPSAQSCLSGIADAIGRTIIPLTQDQLLSGSTGAALSRAGFANETPLWFYVLKEAELLNAGEKLGPLGSRIIAETVFGLLLNDPNSYLRQKGSDQGHWHPRDMAKVSGVIPDSFENMLRSALLL